jgi:hypothetical protein
VALGEQIGFVKSRILVQGFPSINLLVINHLHKAFKPVGWAKLVWRKATAHHRVGRRAKKDGACVGRPRLESLELARYAALAFLVAVGRAGFDCGFAAVFLMACAFSFAANSDLTFWAMASVSTL